MIAYLDTSVVIRRLTGQRPLDALHLASALAVAPSLERPLTFLTRDRQLGRGASSVGLRVEGT